jgi:hypothetical protein
VPAQAAPSAGTIPLGRLLEVAWLTPPQAVLLGALALEHFDGTRGCDAGSVRVTGTGAVVLDPAPAIGPVDGSVPALLSLLRRNTHLRAHHPAAADTQLLRGLEATNADPAAEAHRLRALLHAQGCDAGRLGRQLGALVRQSRLDALPPAADGAVLPIRVPGHRPSDRAGHRTHRGRVAGVVVAACAVVLLTVAYFAVTGQATPFLHRLFGTGSPPVATGGDHPAGHRPPPPRKPVHHAARQHHRFGPLSAGPVHRVSLQAGGCTPGTACTARVTVSTSPATAGEAVSWRVGVVDRCARRTTWSAPVSVTAQPGWTSVYASATVTLPRTHRAALVARTTAPAHAVSQPVPLPGGHC